uniref:PKHD1 like 1 n=1 Tax=Leptobrachium leishanense TaxID=445787 RepID=A0A8C5R062_9ANUR
GAGLWFSGICFRFINTCNCSTDFANNQFNYGDGNDNLGNNVQMVSSTMSYPCDVLKDSSNANKIICYTRYCAYFSEITSISPSSGSVGGGTIITITGRYFDHTGSPANVAVGGMVLFDRCGNRGLKFEKWNNTYSLDGALQFNQSTTGYEGESWVDGAYTTLPPPNSSNSSNSSSSSFVARLSGFLIPPDTDYYHLYIRGNYEYQLYFDITGNPTKIASGYSTSSYNSYGSQKSSGLNLQEGKPYYIEAYVASYAGQGVIDVGLYKRGSSYLEAQTTDAVNEVQMIQSQSILRQETQIISLKNWATSSAVQEVQTITITKTCSPQCPALYYTLIYDQEKTVMLSADATSDKVQSALNNLWSLHPDTVQVTMESDDLQTFYDVTFISQRGDFKLLAYEIPKGSNMTISVMEKIKGAPDMNTFTLLWNGVYSQPLSVNASSEEVGYLFVDYNYYYYYYNRGLVTPEKGAYCGRYALRNPSILFDSGYQASYGTYGPISLDLHSQVTFDIKLCFSYCLFYFIQSPEEYSENGATYKASTWPQGSFIQINRTQAASPPIGGNFSIKAYGKEIKDLRPDISELDLQYALQTIPELGRVSVYARYGSCTGYTWYIRFLTAAGYQPLLQIDNSTVTGLNATFSTNKVTSGGLFRQHLFGDLVRTAHAKPQVEVFINGVPSKCVNDCGYMWDQEQTPVIDSIKVTRGKLDNMVNNCMFFCTKLGGTLVTIFGKGFSIDSEVKFGDESCDVIFANLNTIKCRTSVVSRTCFIVRLNGSLTDAFQYSSSYTPTITAISPRTANVLGGTALTISGLNFNDPSPGSSVFIGKETCKIIDWNPTQITCTFPSLSPGIYPISAYVVNWGLTSGGLNSMSVEYILQVNSIFPQHGSLYGGTKITVTGSGFNGVPEKNRVKIGSIPCDVSSSSENKLVCAIQSGNVYNVTNNGVHKAYGIGYAWSPARLDIFVGDTVAWSWRTQPFIQDIGYRVFSVSDPGNTFYDGRAFSSVFSYQFTSPGVYYYSSGYVDNGKTIFMQGTVYVSPAQDQNRGVYLSVEGIEADYVPESASPDYPSAGCTSEDEECDEPSPLSQSSGAILFRFSKCYSATITRISPSSGTIHTSITINGTGFSNITCANQVTVGKYPCMVSHADENSIVCQVDPQNAMSVGIAELVSLTVSNHGNAINTMTQEMERRFALLPHIDNITPTNGSTTGFTRLTIQGSGFSNDNGSIIIAGIGCSITSVNYTHIICDTQPSYTHNAYISVSVNGIPCQCMRSCYFLYTADVTPVILDVYPAIIHNVSTTLYINGSGFGDNVDDILVYAGDVMLEVVDVNDTLISCSIDPLPAGTYAVRVIVLSKGLASGNPTISSPAEATIITTSGSIEGGTVLVIQGNGFYSLNATKVSIGGIMCPIISISAGEIHCVTPAASYAGQRSVIIVVQTVQYPTQSFTYSESDTPTVTAVLPDTGPSGTLITVSGSLFGMDATHVAVTIGGTQCNITNIEDTKLQCIIDDHLGGTYPVRLKNVKGYARTSASFKYELTLSSVSPNQGSFGGRLAITLTGSGFDPLTSNVFVCNSECKVDRLRSDSKALICDVPEQDDTDSDKLCDVRVVNENDSIQKHGAFSYSSTLTSVVDDVTPKRGGTGGGTRLTITGSKFRYLTFSLPKMPLFFCLYFLIFFQVKNNFFYIDVWSSNYTWGLESPPDEGSLAVITQGQTILLDQSTPVLKMLLIQGGTLVFDEADIELQSENILITDGGVLQVGTEEAPFQHKAIITLHGHLRSPELPLYGAKTLAVREGILDLHGLPVPVTWTHLAQTAEAGTSTITLKQSVTWKAGDEIVIASTGDRLSQKENEKRTILSVSADGKTLTLEEPLTYKHLGISITLPDDSVFEARAEVGLLTRNVVVRGSTNMEWSETIPACPEGFDPGESAIQTCFQGRSGQESNSDQFGGCIMFHAPKQDKNLAIGRIEYVEISHVGQAFQLGRYPINFHLMGDLQFKSYVRGCGIHQTYNRAVTISNTHHLLVEHNVIYDIMGNAFFFENGVEHGNVLQYNLAIFVRQSTSLLNDDLTPAAYWVTNPNNTIRHNAAAGGTHFGFWYRLNDNTYSAEYCQERVPLGEFYNNTVHSQGWFGLWIFERYFPMSMCYSSTPQPAVFKSLTAWNCQKGAEWVNGGALQFHNFSVINNEAVGIESQRVSIDYVGGWGETNGAVIKNSVIVGHLDELGTNLCTSKGIILPYDDGLTVSSVKFMNFDRPNCAALGVTSTCSNQCGGWSAKFDGIQYFNTTNKAGFRREHEIVFIDTDGTLAGGAGYKVVPESGLLDPSQCSKVDDWSVGFPGYVCNSSVSFHRMTLNNYMYSGNPIISNSFGGSFVNYGWPLLLPNADAFSLNFRDAGNSPTIYYSATFYGFKNEDYVFISQNFTQPDMVSIIDQRNRSEEELSYSTSSNGDWHFNENTTTLTYIVSGKQKVRKRAVAGMLDPSVTNINVNVHIYRCYYKGCISPPPSTALGGVAPIPRRVGCNHQILWSDNSFWESSFENKYTVPTNGSDVVIPKGLWVIADVALPWMNSLTIYGTLELRNLTNSIQESTITYNTTILNATYISIQGGHLIGGQENDPFLGELLIILRGNRSTPDFPLPNGPNQGSKAIGVFGQLDLHGIPRSVYKTKLAQTASAGSTSIALADGVDWKVGEDIVITTSSYSAWQTETRKIISVSSDNTTLTLNASLTYTHIAVTHQVPNTALNYTMAADVALLSRNIKIIGEDYPGWYQESFGARVLVSVFAMNNIEYAGSAKIENVEFYHSGQEGFTGTTDPRYSVTFLNLGEAEGNSYVRGCALHNGFAPAIGILNTNGLDIDDNVIHFTVGEGIGVWGERIRVRRNLVTLSVVSGTYRARLTTNNYEWKAGIEVNRGRDIVVQNNVVAGFERAGYRINGEPCPNANNPNEEWLNNEAHGGLFGVYMNDDGLPGCSLIRRFLVWKCWDYGIYTQTIDSVEISDVVLVDNGMGILPIVYGPPSVSHQASNKTITIRNSLLVGSSPEFECKDVLNASDANIQLSMSHRSTRPPKGGRSGICWPTFSSSHNGAPRTSHAGIMSYNAISGLMSVKDTTFVTYRNVCSGEANVMFMTNPLNEDLQHPIHVSGIRIVDSSEDGKVFIHRPDLSKVNPSDCVDMTCDAKRKALLKDLDGSFLGSEGAVVPQAEYQWNGLSSYGLGDYRIPKVMLTSLNGSRIPVSRVAPYKGAIRDSTCMYMSAWEGYKCTGLNYEMLVIESLDSDMETRRLSPVAVLGDGYLDLINGPQDHSRCSGYTCKKRLSMFHAIVATKKSFDVFFTSTSPQKLKLTLLNCDDSKAVRVAIYFSNPQRLDVYANNVYIYPTNVQFAGAGTDFTLKPPTYPGQYLPQFTSTGLGENYFDRDYNMLYIMVRGSSPVVIRTSPLIVISFNLPAMTVDQFYGENLVRNLALFLKIPANKIRVTKIIAEGGHRRRRAAGALSVEVEIADPPAPQTNTTENETSKCIVGLSSYLNVTVTSLAISDPVPPPDNPNWSQNITRTPPSSGNYLATVSTLKVVLEPVAGLPGHMLSQQPAVMALDSNGNCIDVSVSAMTLTAKLKYSDNTYVSDGLGGNTTIPFSSCWANYTNLVLKVKGKMYHFLYTFEDHYHSLCLSAHYLVLCVSIQMKRRGPCSCGNSQSRRVGVETGGEDCKVRVMD